MYAYSSHFTYRGHGGKTEAQRARWHNSNLELEFEPDSMNLKPIITL